ncbi:MAG: hypothetical protein H6696_13960 [Deferribacteres bacterium]|nr:hypothetical protein [candidate division KSB1 bacterium]MCB9503032.1 hypothetical protein [Deferribacteres bacterium]
MNRLFFILGFGVLFCCTKTHYLPQGGVRPKNPNFKLSKNPYVLIDTQLVDISAIYLETWNVDTGPKEIYSDPSYVFFRFFENGRIYHSNVFDHFPTVKEQNDFKMGMIGYYKIKDGNKITTEVFFPINSGQYLMEYGIVKGDSILFHKRKMDNSWYSSTQKIDKRLYRVQDERVHLYAQPNW